MTKVISKNLQSPLQPTLDAICNGIKTHKQSIYIRDPDKFTIEATSRQAERILSFLPKFRMELEKLGISIVHIDGQIYLSKYGDKYTVRIRERKREVRTLRKRKEAWQKDYEINLVWSGILAVSFNNWSYGEWYERRSRQLETSAEAIAIKVNIKFEDAEQYRQEQRRAEIIREQRRLEREANEERQRLEKRRYSFLEHYFSVRQEIYKIQRMREDIHLMFEDANDVHMRKIDKWLQNEAARLGSQISQKAIKEQLASSGLFDAVTI